MSVEAAAETLIERFQRDVAGTFTSFIALNNPTPIFRDNEAHSTEGFPAYLLIGVQHGETEQISMGSIGQRTYRSRGILTILHAIRAGERTVEGTRAVQFPELLAKTREVMEGRRFGTAEITEAIQANILGLVGGTYRSIISIPFWVYSRR